MLASARDILKTEIIYKLGLHRWLAVCAADPGDYISLSQFASKLVNRKKKSP